jgi:hypothetical protein
MSLYRLLVYHDEGDRVESFALCPIKPGWETRHVVFAPTIPDAARSIAMRLARMAAGASSSEAWANPDPDGPGDCDCHFSRGEPYHRCPLCRG